MAKYVFKPREAADDYQLVRKGWLVDERLEVYFTKNHFGRYVLSVCCKGECATTNMMSGIEAVKIVDLLKKLDVSKTDLQNTRFPKGTDQNAVDHLGQIVTILAAVIPAK